jgi:hypothetical protein
VLNTFLQRRSRHIEPLYVYIKECAKCPLLNAEKDNCLWLSPKRGPALKYFLGYWFMLFRLH